MTKRPYLLPSNVKTSDALYSIWSALDADPQQLAARLRQGEASKAEMSLAADLIEKKIKPRRPRSSREQRLHIAEHVALLKWVFPKWQRKKIVSVAIKHLKNRPGYPHHRHISERHIYNALAEFDGNAVAHIKQLPKSEVERVIEPDPGLREFLKNCSREILVEMLEDFFARE